MEEKTELRKMEELDARIEKLNYDLRSLETRKKEMEDNKNCLQEEIDRMEMDKKNILEKTDNMGTVKRAIYIIVKLRTDLKRVELINTRISELKKEKDNVQNKIDIQNQLYVETVKEKDKYVEQRRDLYTAKIQQDEKEEKTIIAKALTQIYDITTEFKSNRIMNAVRQLIEKEINQHLEGNKGRSKNVQAKEEQEEME